MAAGSSVTVSGLDREGRRGGGVVERSSVNVLWSCSSTVARARWRCRGWFHRPLFLTEKEGEVAVSWAISPILVPRPLDHSSTCSAWLLDRADALFDLDKMSPKP